LFTTVNKFVDKSGIWLQAIFQKFSHISG